MPLRKLGIGTYVAGSPNSPSQSPTDTSPEKSKDNPFYPIATATTSTRVFDVVHMFSGRGISAVPIIDENGIVVNLYETVDVIVRTHLLILISEMTYSHADSCSFGCLSIPRSNNCRGFEGTVPGLPWCRNLQCIRFSGESVTTYRGAQGTSPCRGGRRGKLPTSPKVSHI